MVRKKRKSQSRFELRDSGQTKANFRNRNQEQTHWGGFMKATGNSWGALREGGLRTLGR